ncbi:MAG: hypothetical protein AAFQ02_07320 [Bacteroidota bacterium]
MNPVLITLLEVVKYSIPAVIIYYLMRQFYAQQTFLSQSKRATEVSSQTLPLRLQAYERLTLLVERIGLADLVMRLSNRDMNATTLKNAMIIAIQKEYEHNLSQQIYVSHELWQMITLLKNETIANVTDALSSASAGDIAVFKAELYRRNDQLDQTFAAKVRTAMRKEVQLYF